MRAATVPIYHSAHRPPADNLTPAKRYAARGSVAFQHDIFQPLPKEFKRCDVFYVEAPWAKGFPVFQKRAKAKAAKTFEQYMARVGELIESLSQPFYLLGGKAMRNSLPVAAAMIETTLNKGNCLLYVYRPEVKRVPAYADNYAVLADLAARYEYVGDFCCGYGNTGRIFAEHGKRFVMSDWNADCIGYVAAHAREWR